MITYTIKQGTFWNGCTSFAVYGKLSSGIEFHIINAYDQEEAEKVVRTAQERNAKSWDLAQWNVNCPFCAADKPHTCGEHDEHIMIAQFARECRDRLARRKADGNTEYSL